MARLRVGVNSGLRPCARWAADGVVSHVVVGVHGVNTASRAEGEAPEAGLLIAVEPAGTSRRPGLVEAVLGCG